MVKGAGGGVGTGEALGAMDDSDIPRDKECLRGLGSASQLNGW